MNGLKFINFGDYYNRWSLEKVIEITNKVKEYTDKKGIEDPELYEVEDCSYEDKINNRINIRIRYYKDNQLHEQILMILKGEIIDATEFHKRFDEFYPRNVKENKQ